MIRKMRVDDLECVVELHKDLFPPFYTEMGQPDSVLSNTLQRYIEKESYDSFVFDNGETVIGYVFMESHISYEPNSAKLICLGVDSNHHGNRIGTQLLNHVEDTVISLGKEKITLVVYSADSKTVIEFYQKAGFIINPADPEQDLLEKRYPVGVGLK